MLITADSGGKLNQQAAQRAARDITGRMKALPEVRSVGAPVPARTARPCSYR
ncbi:hypothetical protein GCM10017744_009270 [Streptomyces antimycoticus]